MTKQFDSTVFLFMTSDNTCIIGCFQLENENLMCEHPKHQVNISRIRVYVRRILAIFLGHPVHPIILRWIKPFIHSFNTCGEG